MTSSSVSSLSGAASRTAASRIDPQQAQQAVGAISVGLGSLAVLAPSWTARAFGVPATSAVPLLVRMVGVRNATAGVRTLQAQGDDERRTALKAGLVLGAVDVAAVVLAARKGALSKAAAARALLLLAAIAALGVAAGREA